MKLYIDYVKPNSLKELIQALFSNDYSHPVWMYAIPTYYDEKCTELQCEAQRRSFDDILCLAKTYFPNTTEVDLLKTLKDLKVPFNHCNEINKLVFAYVESYNELSIEALENYEHSPYTEGTYTASRLVDIYKEAYA